MCYKKPAKKQQNNSFFVKIWNYIFKQFTDNNMKRNYSTEHDNKVYVRTISKVFKFIISDFKKF